MRVKMFTFGTFQATGLRKKWVGKEVKNKCANKYANCQIIIYYVAATVLTLLFALQVGKYIN